MPGVLKSGDRFGGRYLVETLIAEGGMASIYLARDEQLGKRVAVKVLYPYYSENEVIRARFIEEGNIQRALGHPNVVQVHMVSQDPLAIVMEHVEGPTLDDYLAEQGQLSEGEVLDIIVPVLSALGMAHSKGIIHRDLKPSNILLTRLRTGFQPKVMDFGVAKVKDAKHNLTATGTTVGTLHYMSPEQIVGSKHIDGRADIYSIGVTLYKLVTGEVPFNAPTEFALMMAQVEAPPLPPSKLRIGLSPELERVILKAMEKKADDRFQTVRQFTTALLEMRRGKGSTVRDTITETVSQELIDFAMAADTVAQDRTSEMSLRVIREAMLPDETDDNNEPTVEIDSMKIHALIDSRPRWSVSDEPTQDSTVELTASEIIRMSTSDGDKTADAELPRPTSGAETDVMPRRSDVSLGVTRPSQATSGLQGTGSLVSESVDTASINRRVSLDAGNVVVLDHDANSRDMTAPKVAERAYQEAIASSLPRPSGPKVVLGYNPADTEDKTFEKPNFRTRLPAFETAKSNEDFENPIRRVRRETPDPPRPSTRPEESALDLAVRLPRPDPSASISERIDFVAQSAIRSAEEHDLPKGLLLLGVIAVFVIIGCVIVVMGYWLLV